MLKFQKKLTSSFLIFAPTRNRDAGRQPPDRILARLKSPYPYGRGIKTRLSNNYKYSSGQHDL